MNTIKIDRKNTLMVAHRGVSRLEPENTHLAFVAAGNRSYYGIETDIHCTADGNFILTHDDNVKRVAGIELVAEQTDYATLRSLKLLDLDGTATREDIRMPSLEEYIRICKKYEKVCVAELKNHMTEENVCRIIDCIEAEGYLENVIFISFDFENLVYVRNYRPTQRVQFLFSKYRDEYFDKVTEHGFDVDAYYKILTEELVEKFHAAGIKVNCWTVDRPEDAERLISWGVDFITTNILE